MDARPVSPSALAGGGTRQVATTRALKIREFLIITPPKNPPLEATIVLAVALSAAKWARVPRDNDGGCVLREGYKV